jgi:hypothetical protein
MMAETQHTDPVERVYIAGPMTGIKDYNYPAFHAAAAEWRSLGFHVENPAEVEPQASWAAYMKVGLRKLLTCDTVVFLPGWTASRGAVLEWLLASVLGMAVVYPGCTQPSKRLVGLAFMLRDGVDQ